jgi:hypothetical protein
VQSAVRPSTVRVRFAVHLLFPTIRFRKRMQTLDCATTHSSTTALGFEDSVGQGNTTQTVTSYNHHKCQGQFRPGTHSLNPNPMSSSCAPLPNSTIPQVHNPTCASLGHLSYAGTTFSSRAQSLLLLSVDKVTTICALAQNKITQLPAAVDACGHTILLHIISLHVYDPFLLRSPHQA